MAIPINKQGGRATYYYPSLVQSIGDTFVCEADQFGERHAFKNESFSEQSVRNCWPGPAQLPQSMFEDQRNCTLHRNRTSTRDRQSSAINSWTR